MPEPGEAGVATFGGALANYTIRVDAASGNWMVQDDRPGSSEGTRVVGPNVVILTFADVSISGPGAGAAPPTTGMTLQEIDNALEVSGSPPTPVLEDSTGSGAIHARLERYAHDCVRTGPSDDRLYTRCALVFSLTNTTTETLIWTSGRWHTASAVRPGMDERGVPYGARSIKAGEKITLKSFCIVPTGQGTGTWAAWGAAAYPNSLGGAALTWRLTTTCP
jgi:hypothetical protein